jgi:3-deoxy-manno-octulosonate cytidylyltransferase (CMP-KDO synthetase)
MKTVCVIPARMASSRYPGKPMVPILGLPLTMHVLERCRLAKGLDRIVVATCDKVIFDAARARDAEAVMTEDTHPGCVDRTVEAIEKLGADLADDDLVLMVQGDEILVTPEMLGRVIETYRKTKASVVNLASAILNDADHQDPNVVKVCGAPDGRALFFSRAPIPSKSRAKGPIAVFQQTGIIGFSKSFLFKFGALPRTPLEMAEQIDMLRTLEHGYEIRLVTVATETIGVDTPADRDRAEEALRADPVTARYLKRAS